MEEWQYRPREVMPRIRPTLYGKNKRSGVLAL